MGKIFLVLVLKHFFSGGQLLHMVRRHDLKYLGQKPKTNGWIGRWTLAGPFRRRFSTGMWQNAHINTVRHAMACYVYFSFSMICNFIKRAVHM